METPITYDVLTLNRLLRVTRLDLDAISRRVVALEKREGGRTVRGSRKPAIDPVMDVFVISDD